MRINLDIEDVSRESAMYLLDLPRDNAAQHWIAYALGSNPELDEEIRDLFTDELPVNTQIYFYLDS